MKSLNLNNPYFLKIILTAFLTAMLVACGGSGGGGEVITKDPIKFTALSVLPNKQGIARITGGDTVGMIFSVELADVIASANSSANDDSSIAKIDPNDFPIISTTATTKTRRGTSTSDGVTLNITVVQNNATDNAAGIYLEIPNEPDIIMVVGESLSAIPASGTITYRGFFTKNAASVVAPGQIGSFVMIVDFGLNTFTINATTSSMALSGGGVINPSNGLYASTNLSVGVDGVTYIASLYGNLNGISANSVSGIFHTNDFAPDFSGSFIGSR